MYAIALNPTYLLLENGDLPDRAEFCLEKICPYMTQKIVVELAPGEAGMPVLSWQLAKQLDEQRRNHPQLNAFRFVPLRPEDGWPVPQRIEHFDGIEPGKLLLLTANLRRGLGDMILLLPIFRAQAESLASRGWPARFGLSTSTNFACLFYNQPFVEQILPECPQISQVVQFDYAMEYGLNLDRMKRLIGIRDWRQIDLQARLFVPESRRRRWEAFLPPNRPRIFVNWESFDRRRTLSPELFADLSAAYSDAGFYCSRHNDNRVGEIFPGGPVNMFGYQEDLQDFLALVGCMDVVITTNTGVAHVAAALQKPTIVIFTGRLYGWEGYWPDLIPELYPTMIPIGLDEGLNIEPQQIRRQLFQHLERCLADASVGAGEGEVSH